MFSSPSVLAGAVGTGPEGLMHPCAMPVASGAFAITAFATCSASASVPAGAGMVAIRHSASARVPA